MYNFCPNCGKKISKNINFCPNCGFNLNQPQKNKNTPSKNINPLEPQNNKSKNKYNTPIIIIGYILTILGSILGLIVAIYLVTRKDPITKKHGSIQIAILIIEFIIIIILISFGIIDLNTILNKTNNTIQNITNLK